MDTHGYTRWEDKGRGSEFTVNAKCLKLGTGVLEQKEQATKTSSCYDGEEGLQPGEQTQSIVTF